MAGLYDLGRRLGSGHFAEVRLARHVFTGERVAVKVIEKGRLGGAAAARLRREVGCMKLVQHPNVVRLYQVLETPARLYLVLELGDGGDLFDLLTRRPGGLAEARAKGYFAQVVHAIAYCHRLHVVHRDLKPENVLFFQRQGVVKLTDFGFSSCFQPGTMLATSCGSLAYSAPEILLGEEYDAPAVGKGRRARGIWAPRGTGAPGTPVAQRRRGSATPAGRPERRARGPAGCRLTRGRCVDRVAGPALALGRPGSGEQQGSSGGGAVPGGRLE